MTCCDEDLGFALDANFNTDWKEWELKEGEEEDMKKDEKEEEGKD